MDDTTRQKVEESPEERKRRIRRQRMIQERRRRRRRKTLILRGILVLIFILILVGIGSAVSCGCSCGSSCCLRRRRLRLSKNTLASITRTKSRGIKSWSNKPPISCTSLIYCPQAFPRPPGLPRQSCGASAYLPECCSGGSNPLRPSGRWPVLLPSLSAP